MNGREIYGDEIFQIADNISIRIIEGWVVGIDKSVKLLTSFMKWRSRQTRRVAKIFIPRDKESELNSFLESIGGREIGKCKV